MIEVEVGDTIVEFPDGTTPEVITAALRKAFPKQQAQEHVGYAEDIAKSVPSGFARGVAGLVGLPGAAQAGVKWLGDKLEGAIRGSVPEREAPPPSLLPTPAQVQSGIERVTGPLYKSQTTPGKYAGTMAEFAPAALAGPGGAIRNLINFSAIPGAASEAAGQMTEGTDAEPWARGGAALATGGAAALLNRPAGAQRGIRNAMSPNVDDAALVQAQALMDDAAARGVRLTIAEALEQGAPGSGLTNLQRTLEASPGSREPMAQFMAQRPAQVENAARQSFDNIAPPNQAPSTIGPAVGTAAEGEINQVRQNINAVAEPFYDAASTVRLTQQEMARVRALPGFEEARNAVRNDPQLNRYVAQLPEDSIGFLNEVKKFLDQQRTNAAAPVNAQQNMQRSAGYGRDAAAVRGAAVNASFGNPARNYETALNIEAQGRQQFLQPLLDGPLGKIAARDTTTKKAIDALFPANPLPNSEQEIATAMNALVGRNQRAARDLVRAHAEATFNEAAQNLQGGASQWGGAKFAAVIAGNPQQRANLEAAVRALPNGDQTWTGFNRFLEIVEATGTRQAVGSKTAYNAQELKDLSTGGLVGNAAKIGASPGRWPTVVFDAWSRWQLGRNLDQMANILTDPNAGNLLRGIARIPPASGEAVIAAGRLIQITSTARER
jgi:hypothetical protein